MCDSVTELTIENKAFGQEGDSGSLVTGLSTFSELERHRVICDEGHYVKISR